LNGKTTAILRFLAIALPPAYALAMIAYPPVVELRLQNGEAIAIWRTQFAWQLRWLFWTLTIALPIAGAFLLAPSRRGKKTLTKTPAPLPPQGGEDSGEGGAYQRLLHILRPLTFLPLAVIPMLLSAALPRWILSTIFFYVPALIASAIAWRWYESSARKAGDQDGTETPSRPRRLILGAFLIGSVLFGSLGLYFTEVAGSHVGDEAHYRTIAISLYKHRTLDLKPLMIDKLREDGDDPTDPEALEKRRNSIHCNPKSKGGHWYSTHSYGLPLLLAPFEGAGNLGRHIALGLIAGLACAGMLALCIAVAGEPRLDAILITLVLALSYVWSGYAARCLPETLGAALLVWAYWAIVDQPTHRWRSLAVAAACCIYMPFAHVRYIPMSLLAFGFYGLYGLFGKERWPPKVLRLGIFTVVCLAGYIAYCAIQSSMFQGGDPYRVTEARMAPVRMGAWWSISDTKGLVHIWPAFLWLFAAQIFSLIHDRESRPFVAAVLIAFFVNIMLTCTTPGWRNGSSLPGKKLVVVLPLLLPAAVIALRHSSRFARRWLIFLAAVSTGYTFATAVGLETVGRSFHQGPLALSSKLPALHNLLDPHVAHGRPHAVRTATLVSDSWVAGAFLLTALMLMIRTRGHWFHQGLVTSICVWAVIAHVFVHMNHEDAVVSKGQLQRRLETLDMQRVCVPAPFPSAPLPLGTSIADHGRLCSVTTDDLGEYVLNDMYSLPHIESNDWADREHKWATLMVPFRPAEGHMILSVSGRIEGDVAPVLALREGAHTIAERAITVSSNGTVEAAFGFKANGGRGDLYVLMRLEGGAGTLHGENIYISAASKRFLEQTGLTPPQNLTYITNYP